jgi:hypothetical protein
MSASTEITREIATLLRGTTRANGYQSNVGATVFLGQLRGGKTQAPCCYVIPGQHDPTSVMYGAAREVRRSYEIKAIVDANDHATLEDIDLVDLIIWDVRSVIETNEDRLGGLVQRISWTGDRPGYREDGGSLVGASINYDVIYRVNIDDPTTAI